MRTTCTALILAGTDSQRSYCGIYIHYVINGFPVCCSQRLCTTHGFEAEEITVFQPYLCLVCRNSAAVYFTARIFPDIRYSGGESSVQLLGSCDPDCLKSQETSPRTLRTLTAVFDAATLVLTIPSILIPTSALPIPSFIRRATPFPLSKTVVYLVAMCISLLPKSVSGVLSDITWILAYSSTYMLPGTCHLPLIIMP